ncbi:hypothetical protein GCM10023175_22400 [Pseudonocardia xishanensis]|uniref:RiboL-PSP-HEPN domain-containing protein n=2 Tax=Pseudonocardia xishanensis TaxID=630995 RepID=A0ABP8RQR0_9PSEU
MRELPAALTADIASLRLERRHLPISFLVATEAGTFRKCGTDTINSLVARADLVRVVLTHSNDPRPVPDFGELLNLADGSTIGEKNFVALWLLLGLDGDWMNHPNDRLLLREIKEKRNDVAHWQEDPVEIGRKKKPSDLIAMVDRLVALLDHLNLHIVYWFEQMNGSTPVASVSRGQQQ